MANQIVIFNNPQFGEITYHSSKGQRNGTL